MTAIKAVSIVGKMKTGKTTLGLSAPKPLVVFDFELGVDRVEPRYLKDMDKVTVIPYVGEMAALRRREVENIKKLKKLAAADVGGRSASAKSFWNKLLRDFNQALEDESVKSIMFDTFSSVWEARRLAFLEEIQERDPNRTSLTPTEYFIPNTDMKMLITQALLHDKLLLLVHHTRSKYVNNQETSEEEPDGFKYTGDLVDVEVWMSKRKNEKGIMTPYGTIKACRLCMAVEGTELEAPTIDVMTTLINARRGAA